VRAHRAFLDEQAAEREQERDEFARQLQHLRDLLKERDRDRHEVAARIKEVCAFLSEKISFENIQFHF
jgi:uncharacterized coiled-coil DUF342 family protein